MTTDTSRTIEIEASPLKLLGIFVIGIAMTAGSAAVASWIPNVGSYGKFIGWIGLVFFGFCTLVVLWRAFTQHGSVVTISRDGIRDTRIAAEFIPWRAIKGISTWNYLQQQAMVLAVDPAVERTLTLTRMARWSRGANRALGADGLCVAAAGIKIGFATLLATSMAYWQARRT